MSLISIEQLGDDVQLGLWRIDEPESAIDYDRYPDLLQVHSPTRRLEKFAVRSLLHCMTGNEHLAIYHLSTQKPVVAGWNLSLSHTRGYAAVMLSRQHQVAVDIEYMSPRVSRIVNKFIRSDEHAPTLIHQLVNWSAKETIYKFFSDQHLQYFDMRLHAFLPAPEGQVVVDNLPGHASLAVYYRQNAAFVLTFTYGKQIDGLTG